MPRYVVKPTGRLTDDGVITDPDGAELFRYVDHVICSPDGGGLVRIARHHGFHLRADIQRGGVDIATVHEMTGSEKHAQGRGHGLRLPRRRSWGAGEIEITGDPVYGTTFSRNGQLVARMAPTWSWWRGLFPAASVSRSNRRKMTSCCWPSPLPPSGLPGLGNRLCSVGRDWNSRRLSLVAGSGLLERTR